MKLSNIWINIMFLLENSYMNYLFFSFIRNFLHESIFIYFFFFILVLCYYKFYILLLFRFSIYVSYFFFYNYCIRNLIFTLYLFNKTWRDSIIVVIFIFLIIIFWIISLQNFIFPTQINCQIIWITIFNYQLTNLFSLKYMLSR